MGREREVGAGADSSHLPKRKACLRRWGGNATRVDTTPKDKKCIKKCLDISCIGAVCTVASWCLNVPIHHARAVMKRRLTLTGSHSPCRHTPQLWRPAPSSFHLTPRLVGVDQSPLVQPSRRGDRQRVICAAGHRFDGLVRYAIHLPPYRANPGESCNARGGTQGRRCPPDKSPIGSHR